VVDCDLSWMGGCRGRWVVRDIRDCQGCGGLKVPGGMLVIVVGSGWVGRAGRLSRMREVVGARRVVGEWDRG